MGISYWRITSYMDNIGTSFGKAGTLLAVILTD